MMRPTHHDQLCRRLAVPAIRKSYPLCLAGLLSLLPTACHSGAPAADYDVLIRHGQIVDGSGGAPYAGDIAIRGDRIVAIGSIENAKAKREIDAAGLVVSPGFIDMLGQSELSLLIDNRSQSKLSQGITSEITGEGGSIAPQNQLTIAPQKIILDHYHLTIDWQRSRGLLPPPGKVRHPH